MLWDWVMGTYRPHPQDIGSIERQRKSEAVRKLAAECAHGDSELLRSPKAKGE